MAKKDKSVGNDSLVGIPEDARQAQVLGILQNQIANDKNFARLDFNSFQVSTYPPFQNESTKVISYMYRVGLTIKGRPYFQKEHFEYVWVLLLSSPNKDATMLKGYTKSTPVKDYSYDWMMGRNNWAVLRG